MYDSTLPYWNQMNFSNDDIERFWSKVNVVYDAVGSLDINKCWTMNSSHDKDSYPIFYYNNKSHRASHFIYQCFNGPIPTGCQICHKCDNPECVNPYHLWAGTIQQNTQDRVNKNRSAHGEKIKTSKLTDDIVKQICEDILNHKYSFAKEISIKYNVSLPSICHIFSGNSWKHVTCNYDLKMIQQILFKSHNKSILDSDDILLISELYKNKILTVYELSDVFNVSVATISQITNGSKYSDITKITKCDNRHNTNVVDDNTKNMILQDLHNGLSGSYIAKKYNISAMTVSRIKRGIYCTSRNK